MNLELFAEKLEKGENNIYFSKSTSEISYPEKGNQNCLHIEQNSFWFEHRNNIIVAAVKKFSPKGSFFDIGGGNGFVSKAIQENGIEVVLLEPGIDGVLNARNRGIRNIVCSTLEDAGLKSSSLNAVGLFDVIEHIKYDISFLKDINKYLKNNGKIFITVPAFNFLWSAHDEYSGHHKRYNLNELEKLLTQCGFKTLYKTYFFSLLPLPIFLFRSIPFYFGFRNKKNKLKIHKKEHNNNLSKKKILRNIWNWEFQKVKRAEKIYFGGSCLLVAKKND